MRPVKALTAAAVLSFALATPAFAAQCNPPAGFDAFLKEFRKEAAVKGLTPRTLSLLDTVTLDQSVLAADKRQGVFKLSSEEFATPRINQRWNRATKHMVEQAPTLRRVEKEFGVPGAMTIVLWGLETDFGTHTGKHEVLRATATLGFDCRRSEFFQNELFEALSLVQKGDLQPADLRGDWPGELGQAHFLPSSYNKFRHPLRRQRQARPDPQRAGHARLDCQLLQGLRLAAAPALRRRHRQLRSDPQVEQGAGLRQDRGRVRREAGSGLGASRAAAPLT
jgi:membrane-bound lytic murein transglycosylase B